MQIPAYVFTGGGTAGHVVPNIAVMETLLEKMPHAQITYIGSIHGIEHKLISKWSDTLPYKNIIQFHGITSGKLRRYWSFQNFLDPFKVLGAIFQAWWILGKLSVKPKAVFSKGGFVAFPVVVAAWLRRIPVIAHESDLTPGLANRLSYPFSKHILLTFEKTKQFFKKTKKILVTGTPIRHFLWKGEASVGRAICRFNAEKPVLLVIGGGSGARKINEAIRVNLYSLLENWQIIHCCGFGNLIPELQDLEGYTQWEYVNTELPHFYAAASIVLSRAGANTVCEILALRKLAIYVPLSAAASRGDQIDNASWIVDEGLGFMLSEHDLLIAAKNETLKDVLESVYADKKLYQQKMAQWSIYQRATQTIVQLLEKFTRS